MVVTNAKIRAAGAKLDLSQPKAENSLKHVPSSNSQPDSSFAQPIVSQVRRLADLRRLCGAHRGFLLAARPGRE